MAKRGRKPFNVGDHIEEIERLATIGLNDKEICLRVGIHHSTLCKYKNKFSELTEAIKRGRALCHAKIGGKLYQAAMDGNIPAAMFLLKTRFGYRETGPVQTEENEAPESLNTVYQEIDGRKKEGDK